MRIPKFFLVLLLGTTAVAALASFVAAAGVTSAQADPEENVRRVLANPRLAGAELSIARGHNRIVQDIISLTEIPAPPFQEMQRASAYLKLFTEAGLTNVEKDAEGNVTGIRKGTGGTDGMVAIAAHLDTVFPEGTNVKVKRTGTRLAAPGVGDDTRALAVLVGLVRGMDAAAIRTSSDILFVGDVGEEGAGDLRGMRYLFTKGPYKDRVKSFVSIDGAGAGNTIITGAVGSRRYRVTFKGPGGHSYGEFGLVNPSYALANAVGKLSAMPVPSSPRTTFNVGVIGGGTSVNSIPSNVWMDVDLRSESMQELTTLEKTFEQLMQAATAEENATRSTAQGPITVSLSPIGDRPAGETPADSPIARTAAAAIRASGQAPVFSSASTDSNIPISLGIPAITIDSGGRGGRAHSLDEWIDVEPKASLQGIDTALVILLALAGTN